MKIWRLQSDVNNFDTLLPVKKDDWSKLSFAGKVLECGWTPVPVMSQEEVRPSDTPGLDISAPVFSTKALEILKDLIDGKAEVLPLRCRKGNYFAINVTEVLDCIDYAKSEFKRLPSGKILVFEKYFFKAENVRDKHIFKIVDEPSKRAFVSDAFRERVLSSGLKGFKFVLVWDSEGKPVDYEPFGFLKKGN